MEKVENGNVRMETVEAQHRDRSEYNLFKIGIENYFFFSENEIPLSRDNISELESKGSAKQVSITQEPFGWGRCDHSGV